MRLLTILGLLAACGAAPAQSGQGETMPLREMEGADALKLAKRLLPPAIRGRIVEGEVRRQFLPGQEYWVSYRERGKPAERDVCEKAAYSIHLSVPYTPDKLSPDTPVRIGKTESGKLVAVLRPGRVASPKLCAKAVGYIPLQNEAERQLTAYRVLIASMGTAAGRNPPPFEIDCVATDPNACRDPRKALATLPMDALMSIGVSCTNQNEVTDDSRAGVRIISCRPLQPGQPYEAEVAFGMSGEDGRSWRVSFVHADRWPARISMRRSAIVYH